MSDPLHVVTGATGLLGSHIAEQLVAGGHRVRVLARPTSDVAFLRSLGVEVAVGDLHDHASIRTAVAGADTVYHCAAKVGDWGPWRQFREQVIDATRNLLAACPTGAVRRLLHVSSITVYGHPQTRADLFREDEPLGQRLGLWDYYRHSKIAAEALVREHRPDATILRPSWMYGPRDRNSMPRLLNALRAGRVRLIGAGDNPLNVVYAGDIAEAVLGAANTPTAVGQAYNLSSIGEVTQTGFLDLLTDALGLPRVVRRVPFRVAHVAGFLSEVVGRAIRLKRPPRITRYAVSLVGRSTHYDISKARRELGWEPRTPAREGIQRTVAWLREQASM